MAIQEQAHRMQNHCLVGTTYPARGAARHNPVPFVKNLGVANVFGLSVQDSAYQSEVVERLHLPFALLSDENLTLARSLGLQTFTAGGMELLQRITLIVRDGVLAHVMFPVREPEQNAADVVAWLKRYGSGL